jgi:small subunit ribosomal protein S4
MGDPKKIRSKYQTPVHPWQKERLEQEKSLVQVYGLVNKTEVYKANSKLKKFKDIAKSIVTKQGAQAQVEKQQLFIKLKSLNLVKEESLDDVLGLRLEQLLERRLQTVIFKAGFARTIKQARQMITHRHVLVNGKMITSPSYLVTMDDESKISFYAGSGFSDENHPERKIPEPVKEEAKPKQQEAVKEVKQEVAQNEQ